MKTKLFILGLFGIASFFVSCKPVEPDHSQLIGTWTEEYHINPSVTSLSFGESGVVNYIVKPDTTWPSYPTGGFSTTLQYSVTKDNKLLFYNTKNEKDSEVTPFEYKTDYSITANKLTIDSFSYDGVIFSKSLILFKE